MRAQDLGGEFESRVERRRPGLALLFVPIVLFVRALARGF